jgi:hypothetical protein
MLTQILIDNVGWVMIAWTIIYLSDYYLTIYSARLYRQGANQYLVMEGSFELTPAFQRDVDQLRLFSRRFVAMLFLALGLIFFVWAITPTTTTYGRELFAFLMGMLVLVEAAIHLRHFRNIYLFRQLRNVGALHGRLEQRRWFILQSSAVELLTYAGLWCALYLLTTEAFFLGGAFYCAITAGRHWKLAAKSKTRSAASLEPPTS